MCANFEEKLRAYYQREETDRRDIRGRYISEDILVYPDTRCLGAFLETLNTTSPTEWTQEIVSLGDEEGNHNELEYMRDHILPYLKRDIPRETSFDVSIFETMEELVRLAVRQTNYWGTTHDEEAYCMDPSPLCNPNYREDAKKLSHRMHSSSICWKDFCFAVKMYVFACL